MSRDEKNEKGLLELVFISSLLFFVARFIRVRNGEKILNAFVWTRALFSVDYACLYHLFFVHSRRLRQIDKVVKKRIVAIVSFCMYFEFNEFFSRIALYSSFRNPIDGGWSCWFAVAEVNFFVCSLKDLWVLWFFSSSHYGLVFLKRSECSILFIQRLVFTASTQRQTVSFMGLTTETTAYWVKVNGTGGKKTLNFSN